MQGYWQFTDLERFFTDLPVGIFIGGGLLALGITICFISTLALCAKRRCSSKSKKVDNEMGFDNLGYGMKQDKQLHKEIPVTANLSRRPEGKKHIGDNEDYPDYENTPDRIQLVQNKSTDVSARVGLLKSNERNIKEKTSFGTKVKHPKTTTSLTTNVLHNEHHGKSEENEDDYENTPDKIQLIENEKVNLSPRVAVAENLNKPKYKGKQSSKTRMAQVHQERNDNEDILDYENTPEKIRSYTTERNKDTTKIRTQPTEVVVHSSADINMAPSDDAGVKTYVRKSLHDYDEIGEVDDDISDHDYEDAERYNDDIVEDYENVKQLTLDRRH